MTLKIIFPIVMTLIVAAIMISKEFEITVNGLSRKQRNILFLLEPFVYMILMFSWVLLVDEMPLMAQIVFSFFAGLLFFITVTAIFLRPKEEEEKTFSLDELLTMRVIINETIDDIHYMADLVTNDGKRVAIVVTSYEKLVLNDIAAINKIDGHNIIVTKIGNINGI